MAEPAPAGFDMRRILLLAGVAIVIIIAVLFFFFRGCAPAIRGQNDYTVIYSNLDLRDAANVIARLKELAIPYEIRNEGRAIAIPKQRADEARLGLAEKNLPMGGVVGWEIFDEARLGATDFDRRIQLIRAISGELSRTIRRIQAVEDARVQIVLPETRLFAETVPPVTASVMLRLRPGAELSEAKVNGIIHLVASSVENLQPENVTVVDNTGRILSARAAAAVTPEAISLPLTLPLVEEEIATPEEEVAVEVEVTPEAVEVAPEVTEEVAAVPVKPPLTYEEKVLLMVQAKKELERDLTGKAQEILNRFYPLNSAIVKVDIELKNNNAAKKFEKDQLNIRKITAIILVDNRIDLTKQLKQATFKSVAAAIGYNRKRGDRIVLQLVPFHLATPPPEVIKEEVGKILPPKPTPVIPLNWIMNITWLLVGIGAVIIIILLFRIFKGRPKAGAKFIKEEEVPEAKPAPAISREKMSAIENIRSAVERNPERIAELLRSWLTD